VEGIGFRHKVPEMFKVGVKVIGHDNRWVKLNMEDIELSGILNTAHFVRSRNSLIMA
jgi:hypothetical protein